MTTIRFALVLACAAAGVSSSAMGVTTTIATFDDPALNANTPLFTRNGATFSGGWNTTGLLLRTPGVAAPDYADATFVLSPLTVTTDFGPFALMSGGSIQFFDSSSNPVLRIEFTSASLSNALSLGASDFLANNVTFSGAAVSGLSLSAESFAFSFANPVITDGPVNAHYTVTSAFTSSADVVIPAPSTGLLAGALGLAAARRRRR
jgi:hypothetical protein